MKINKEVRDEIRMYQANDWEIDSEHPEYILLKKNTSSGLGHFFTALFTIWWTFGIGNLIYWLLSKKKKKVFK